MRIPVNFILVQRMLNETGMQGERCRVLGEADHNGWIRVKTSRGIQGFFPANYLAILDGPPPVPEPLDTLMATPQKHP